MDEVEPGSKVLDLGCGDGAVASALWKAGVVWSRYEGIDCNPRLVKLLRQRSLPDVYCHEGDAASPVLDSSVPAFDIVISAFMLEHLDEAIGTRHINMMGKITTVGIILAAPLVLGSSSVVGLGLRGPAEAQTQKWNWGELAARERLKAAGMNRIDFEAYWNPNGVIHEYYLLGRQP
jgi:SAM-dependent methyltransferase